MLPLILASTSPRRIQLLEQVGLKPEVVPPEADETPLKGEKPDALVRRLSREKALSVLLPSLTRYPHCLILAADTIVVAGQGRAGKILGKPVDVADAQRMLKTIAGRTHQVLTGYTWIEARQGEKPRIHTNVIRTEVKIRKLSPAMIGHYVATREPMDKAGSYAAQGVGGSLIDGLRGSYTNVVGLPLSDVLLDLEKKFKIPFLSWR